MTSTVVLPTPDLSATVARLRREFEEAIGRSRQWKRRCKAVERRQRATARHLRWARKLLDDLEAARTVDLKIIFPEGDNEEEDG